MVSITPRDRNQELCYNLNDVITIVIIITIETSV